jgi:hypothetical protein
MTLDQAETTLPEAEQRRHQQDTEPFPMRSST